MENTQPLTTEQEKIDFFLLSAHELRTSLSAMKWFFKMLCDGDYGALNEEQRAAMVQAMHANERMVVLLNSTMNAVKNNTVVTYLKLPVRMTLLVAEITKDFTNEATEKHIAISYHQPGSAVTVLGDESRLRIAFHNIIENAIKYSPSQTEIIVTLSTENDTAVLTVQDHGAGIPDDKKEHLFEKFFRAENTSHSGTGLGLYSSKHVIDQHNGTITIESQEHVGTTVTVKLPLMQ